MRWGGIVLYLLVLTSFYLLPYGEGWVGGDFAHEGFGKEACLEFQAAAVGGFVVEGGMGDGFVEAGFEFGEEGAASVIGQAVGTAEFFDEVFSVEDVVVEEGEDDGVDDEGAEFFHEVEGKGGFAVLAAVQVADVGVEANGADGGHDLVEKDGVAVAEEGVDGVAGGAAGAAVEEVGFVEQVGYTIDRKSTRLNSSH